MVNFLINKLKRCRVCGSTAVVFIPYANAAFCKSHFIAFYERKIKKTLDDYGFKGGKVLVGVSGGKDSMALIYALKRLQNDLNIDLYAVHIDLGIHEYSEKSKKIVSSFLSDLGIEFEIVNVRRFINASIPKVVQTSRRPACAICGLIKRYILNSIAYENDYDYIATGHNLDDVSTYLLKAFLTHRSEDILRAPTPVSPPKKEYKLVGRLRPQLFLSERDNQLYCELNHIPYIDDPCPLSSGASLFKYKLLWTKILETNPVSQINFVKTVFETREKIDESVQKLDFCKYCGYPTTSDDKICAVCRIKLRVNKLKIKTDNRKH